MMNYDKMVVLGVFIWYISGIYLVYLSIAVELMTEQLRPVRFLADIKYID